MKAWLLPHLGDDIDKLVLEETADPVPGAGEVLLRVHVAALNPADRYLAMGQYPARPELPHILGRDGVGEVLAVGEGVTGFAVGQMALVLRSEVGVTRPGMFAQQVCVPAESLVEVPAGWSLEQAAAAPLVYLTALQALTQWDGDHTLPPVETVLVTGASGGVGVATVQLGKAMGLRVLGLSRSAEKSRRLVELGANAVFDPLDAQWARRVRAHLGDSRVDLAVDNVGGAMFPQVLETLGMWGRVSVVGRLAGPVPSFNTSALLFRRLRVGGVALATETAAGSQAAWRKVLALLKRIDARPVVDQVFAFEALPGAFGRLREGPMGKVLLRCL